MSALLPLLAAFALLGSSLAAVSAQALFGLGDGPGMAVSLACGACGWCSVVACGLRGSMAETGRAPSTAAFTAAAAGCAVPWSLAMAAGQAERVPYALAWGLHLLAALAATSAGIVAAWLAVHRDPPPR